MSYRLNAMRWKWFFFLTPTINYFLWNAFEHVLNLQCLRTHVCQRVFSIFNMILSKFAGKILILDRKTYQIICRCQCHVHFHFALKLRSHGMNQSMSRSEFRSEKAFCRTLNQLKRISKSDCDTVTMESNFTQLIPAMPAIDARNKLCV